jgi:uncharacterized protein YceK
MKRIILVLAVASAALAGCAQLREAFSGGADAGATGTEQERSPFPKSMNLG